MAVTIRVENIFRRGWVPIRVENIFDADETTTSDADGQLISTAPSIRVGVGVHRVDRSYKTVLRLQICSRTFVGYKIGCFVIRVPRLHPAATKEDPRLAITMVYFT